MIAHYAELGFILRVEESGRAVFIEKERTLPG